MKRRSSNESEMTYTQESLLKLVQAIMNGVPPPVYRKDIIEPWVKKLPNPEKVNAAVRIEKSAMSIVAKSLLEE